MLHFPCGHNMHNMTDKKNIFSLCFSRLILTICVFVHFHELLFCNNSLAESFWRLHFFKKAMQILLLYSQTFFLFKGHVYLPQAYHWRAARRHK